MLKVQKQFGGLGRAWLGKQPLPQDEQDAIERHLRELDRLGEDLSGLDRILAQAAIGDSAVKRLLTVAGICPSSELLGQGAG